jgi:hypothetical protein
MAEARAQPLRQLLPPPRRIASVIVHLAHLSIESNANGFWEV